MNLFTMASYRSNRKNAQLCIDQFFVAIEIQSQFHLLIHNEISTSKNVDRLNALRDQLITSSSLVEANNYFELAREYGVSDLKLK